MSVSTMVVNDGSALHEGMFQRLIELGIALSAERDTDRLLEMILLEAKRIPDADGGTLYLMGEEEKSLSFAIMRNDTLDIAMGGTTETEIHFPPLQLFDAETGRPNKSNVATAVALDAKTINIADAYVAKDFDFSGTKAFDKKTGYRSMSFLTVPLTNRQREVIGVLQLIRSEEHTSELQSLMRISYAVFCLKKK